MTANATATDPVDTTAAPRRSGVPRRSGAGRMLLLELRRISRDPVTLFFTVALPGFLFLIFGTSEEYAGADIGNGNVAMAIMIAMAGYGAVTTEIRLAPPFYYAEGYHQQYLAKNLTGYSSR